MSGSKTAESQQEGQGGQVHKSVVKTTASGVLGDLVKNLQPPSPETPVVPTSEVNDLTFALLLERLQDVRR